MSVVYGPVFMGDLDLNDTDEIVLRMLREGRVTPKYVADEYDLSRQYVSQRLKRFEEHDIVEKLATGLYELKHDPCEN